MNCEQVQECLGQWLDGELSPESSATVTHHLAVCASCRTAAHDVRILTEPLKVRPQVELPHQLWSSIEHRLFPKNIPQTKAPAPITADRRWAILGMAASLLFFAGVGGWMWSKGWFGGQALACAIDFRPLLEKADGDIEVGIQALIRANGGRSISLADAARVMTIRIHPPAELPARLKLVGTHMLRMGPRHRSLAFHFKGESGQLLLLQCPSNVRKDFGNYECLPCKLNADAEHPLRVGPLNLLHRRSANVCVCIVSTLSDDDLRNVMNAIPIDY